MNKAIRTVIIIMGLFFAIAFILQPVTQVEAAGKVTVSKKNVTLEVGQKTTLKLKNIKTSSAKKARWSSSDKAVAAVRVSRKKATATVTAKKAGTADIKAKIGKKTCICKVKVVEEATPLPLPYEKAEITAHLYEKDKTGTISVLKHPDLDKTVWIDAMDFLKYDFNDSIGFEISHVGDVYTIRKTPGKNTMVIDTAEDKITFDRMEQFIVGEEAFVKEGSLLDNPYVRQESPKYVKGSKIKKAVFDLSKYNIDVVGDGDTVYFPITTISDIFSITYNAAEYVDGEVYFVALGDDIGDDPDNPYVNKTSIFNNLTRTQNEIDFEYNEFCFVMDNLYGFPGRNEYSESLKALGFDKAMDQDEDTRKIKSMIQSSDLVTFNKGLDYLSDIFFDGGHTNAIVTKDFNETPVYADTALAKKWKENLFPEDDNRYYVNGKALPTTFNFMFISSARDDAYEAYEEDPNYVEFTKEDGTRLAAYLQKGDKAFFSFDNFVQEMLPPFVESLDLAKKNGVKDFYIDISCNRGGDEMVVEFMMSMLTGNGDFYRRNAKTGNMTLVKSKADKNMDGVFDRKDDKVKYDFNYKIITSDMSYSCGNFFPCYAAKAGIPVYGLTSGGGACMTFIGVFHTNMQGYAISGYPTIVTKDGVDVEAGAPLTEDWTQYDEEGKVDYSNFYDFINN